MDEIGMGCGYEKGNGHENMEMNERGVTRFTFQKCRQRYIEDV